MLGDGFPRQREAIDAYAKSSGIVVEEEFVDEGVSGTTELSDRDALARLLDRIESNGVRTVLVERSDRLARDLLVGEVILGQFRDLGVSVIEAASGNVLTADNADPTKVLIRQILGAVAEFDRRVTVAKLRAARLRKKARTGRCEGRRPYGVEAGEAEVVGKIKALRRKPTKGKRLSYDEIASQLNSEGIPTRNGGPWRASTIGQILGR